MTNSNEGKAQPAGTDSPIPLGLALLPLLILMALLAGSVALFGDGSSGGPNQISLLMASGVAFIIGGRRGMTWPQMEKVIVDGISLALGACLILLAIGSLIGAWMLAGTAPALIYHGLGILDADWFYPASLIICAMVSVTIGSSWTTAGTIGLALIGIAQVMGLSLEVTAGAVISGAYFGDKLSPLSDTTNLAPAMVGTDLFTHIRHMLWTTVPSVIIALILFTVIGFSTSHTAASTDTIDAIRGILSTEYNLGWPTFLPLVILLFLAFRKFPAFPTIVIGALAGCAVAIFYQPSVVTQFGDPEGGMSAFAASAKAMWMALANGFSASTGDEALDSLLSRGGMSSMLNTIWLIMTAMTFGASMEQTGLLPRIVEVLLKGVRGTGSLIVTTVLTSVGMNVIAADQYIAIVLPGRMYRMEFARRGLAPQNLSRTLEDAGTMTSALIPWNTCGAFMAATLGVPTFAYAPYAFLNIMNPLMAIFYGLTNIKIQPLSPDEVNEIVHLEEHHVGEGPIRH
ncbi:Na+/H+ antiporter NhaC [Gimibacter soli]|uniref:Na+/H+ antiporter NhaC n=1 Tax=Gimibacter soli TaxID=3024400 RepID=A0AAE9XTQ7_9PROT|nr:Na+/H+ antiporter NhaC [Gimibacter soli]WCL54681.1 Na+/H+ antiporter NhaC [Gimibacter soli]